MKKTFNFNKAIYVIIVIFIIAIISAAIIIARNNYKTSNSTTIEESNFSVNYNQYTEADISEIEAVDLPSEAELKNLNLQDVMQSDKITEKFNLYSYETSDGGIKYNYLANAVTNGERLSLTAKVMSEEEYNEMLPKAKAQNNVIGNFNVVYNDRNLYYTEDDSKVSNHFKEAEEKGNIVIRYGNTLSELLPMQQIMWYDNGIGYTLESIGRNYSYEDMAKLLEAFFEEVNK